MTTDNIDFKLGATDTGAVAAFQRLRTEVVNNEKALAGVSKHGKATGKTLKDIASLSGLGGLGGIGEALEKGSEAAGGLESASLLAKAGLVGLVATAGFSVGKMLGDWLFGTEQWTKAIKDAQDQLRATDQVMVSMMAKRIGAETAEIAGLPSVEMTKRRAEAIKRLEIEIGGIDARNAAKRRKADKDDRVVVQSTGYATGIQNMRDQIAADESRRKVMVEQLNILLKMDPIKKADEERSARHADRQAKQDAHQKEKAKVEADNARAAEQQAQREQSLLDGIYAQIIALEQGEEAAMRYRLQLQGMGKEAIDAAINLQRQLDSLQANKAKPTEEPQDRGGQAGRPAALQASQQRFVTRGTGNSNEAKILAANEKQAKTMEALLMENKKLRETIDRRLPQETF